ncbi:MAG: hypothetical protein VX519_07550, partial [Myxococcota bacterium]|nr:hypothetical protein [Myxococcota bacterium]
CQGVDYGIAHPATGWTPGQDIEHLGSAASTINVSFDVGFQRNNWGETLQRCQVEVAFTRVGESDGMGMGEAPMSEPVGIPEEEGWCQTTRFDDVDDDAPPEPRDEEHGPAPGPGDNWHLRGTLDAGCRIWLHGESGSWPLQRQIDHKDRVTYELESCDGREFPFGEVLDLEVSEADARPPLAGLRLEQAFVVGFPLEVEVLLEDPQQGIVYHRVDNPFIVAWEEVGVESGLEGDWEHEEVAVIRVAEFGVADAVEALACRPPVEADEILCGPDQLSDLPHNEFADSDRWSTSFQVDSRYTGLPLATPWGELLRVQSTISDGGLVVLYEQGEIPEHHGGSDMPSR